MAASRGRRLRLPDQQAVTRLARAAQRDDARALDALLTALRPVFTRFFVRHGGHDVAEDLAQRALIRVAEVLGRARPERLAQHTSTIARELLRDEGVRVERERRSHARAAMADHLEWPGDPQRHAEYEDLVRAVARATTLALPSELRRIVLGVLDDRTAAEIAAEAGTDLATVRAFLLRARVILRRELRQFIEH